MAGRHLRFPAEERARRERASRLRRSVGGMWGLTSGRF